MRPEMSLIFSVTATAVLLGADAFSVSPVRSRNAVSFVEDKLRRGASASLSVEGEGASAMGTAVEHGGALYMNTAIPGEIWSLKANFENNNWQWQPAGNAYSQNNPGAPINPVDMSMVGSGPSPAGAPAPAPAPAAAGAPGPAAAPAAAGPSCAALIAQAEKTPGAKGMFLGCKEFTYYGSGVFGKSAPYGCHCAAWTVNCPFETCPIGTAFDEKCLAPSVKKMGFTALSKLSNFVNPASVPKALRKYAVHPDYVSTCMYWLPKPANPALPAVNAAAYSQHLPDFATFYFNYVGAPAQACVAPKLDDVSTMSECAAQVGDEAKLKTTQANLIAALGQAGLSVLSITCGSMSALVTGPPAQLAAAAALSKHPFFCWMAFDKQVCTLKPKTIPCPPAPGPGPAGPAGAPGPAFGAPAPAPAFLPRFTPGVLPPAAPAPALAFAAPAAVVAAPAPVALAPAAAGPAVGGPAPGPAGAPGPAPR